MFFNASDTNSPIGFSRGRVPCATNILAITRQGRRVAQAALKLCASLERRDFVTFISSMSLNAELVACHTSTPWKSRQHERRFGRSYGQARGKRLADRALCYSPSTRRLCSSRISSAMLVRDSRTSSANGAFGGHDRQDNAGTSLGRLET